MPGGHDIKGSVLKSFFDQAMKDCGLKCLNEHEREFYTNVFVPAFKKNPESVFISFALSNTAPSSSVVAHEALHAQHFTQDKFREIDDRYFESSLSKEEQEYVKAKLCASIDVTRRS